MCFLKEEKMTDWKEMYEIMLKVNDNNIKNIDDAVNAERLRIAEMLYNEAKRQRKIFNISGKDRSRYCRCTLEYLANNLVLSVISYP